MSEWLGGWVGGPGVGGVKLGELRGSYGARARAAVRAPVFVCREPTPFECRTIAAMRVRLNQSNVCDCRCAGTSSAQRTAGRQDRMVAAKPLQQASGGGRPMAAGSTSYQGT